MAQRQNDQWVDANGNEAQIVVNTDGTAIGSGSSPATVADGGDVNAGTTTDAAVITDANGTLAAKLRGLIVLILAMSAKLPATLGIKTAAASLSVVTASDQTPIDDGYSFLSIPTQTTTTVKAGAGRLRRIVIPTQVASATVKIYDNTAASGTVIMDTLTMPAALLGDGPMVIEFGAAFATGLTIITAGATMPLTAVYR